MALKPFEFEDTSAIIQVNTCRLEWITDYRVYFSTLNACLVIKIIR